MITIINLDNGIQIGNRLYPPNAYIITDAPAPDKTITLKTLNNAINISTDWTQFEDETNTPYGTKQAVINALLLNNA